tara:strand:- start:337 stop:1500 length:1164 start_codon:yes stop_codon:yes gene_type:complete
MVEKKNIVLLGATGSIGTSTLKVIEKHSDALNLIGIACNRNYEKLLGIAKKFKVKKLCVYDEDTALKARKVAENDLEITTSEEGMIDLATLEEADIILIAVVGVSALKPALEGLKKNKDIAIANKEILVMAGEFIMEAVKSSKGRLLPTDSEHNAIFQCLEGKDPSLVDRLILTASGGPFRDYSLEQMKSIQKEDALKHPNWEMGNKITIDSASMANKGLEIIEAHWLFNHPIDKIEVVIHPQSLVHSMIQMIDGSIISQMSPPLMTFAIQNAILYPNRLSSPDPTIDFTQAMELNFRPPEEDKFPCLKLAKDSLQFGNCGPAAFNAANEIAVDAFLRDQIHFLQIPEIIEQTFHSLSNFNAENLDSLINFDSNARNLATLIIKELK